MNENNENKEQNKFFNDIPQSQASNLNVKEETNNQGIIPDEVNKEDNPDTINLSVDDTNLPQFNNNAATIGELKPDKQKSPLLMIVLFGLLFAFIIFMPEAISLVNKYLGTNLNTNNGVDFSSTDTNDKKDDNNTIDNRIYTISSSLSIKLGDITLSNFTKTQSDDKYIISFTIKNTSTTAYSFAKKLYLDFYNSTDTFIERRLVETESIASSSTINASTEISKETYDNGLKVEGTLRDQDDYPQVSIASNELKCVKGNQTIKYTFKNDKLISINDSTKYFKTSDIESYSTELINKKMEINKLDNINGVTAVLTEDETGYLTTININYETAQYSELTYKNKYYDKDTLSKIIDFELKSSGYSCN